MNDLRLILLLLGAVLITGIYLWGVFQQRNMRRRETVAQDAPSFDLPRLRPIPEDEDEGPVMLDTGSAPASTAGADAIARAVMVPMDPDDEPLPAVAAQARVIQADRALMPAAAVTDARERFITLHVAAPPAQPFTGRAILDAMRAVDLRYGAMKIFHRFDPGAPPSAAPRFSVADMFEPGSFELDAMDEFHTRGLSLFMDANAFADPRPVFEDMLGVAERLAQQLGGEVRDADREMLDAGRIAAIRAGLEH